MNLVGGYGSDSGSDTDKEDSVLERTSELPPIPFEILDKFHKAPSHPSPDLHIRYTKIFTPPAGYFNCYCSLEFLLNYQQLRLIDGVFQDLQMYSKMTNTFKSLPPFTPLLAEESVHNQLHGSLTPNLNVTRKEKTNFQSILKSKLEKLQYSSDEKVVSFDKVRFFWSIDRTKIFAAMGVSEKSRSKIAPLHTLIMESFEEVTENLLIVGESSFEHKNMHISFAETTGSMRRPDDQILEELETEVVDLRIPEELVFTFDSVKVQNGTSRLSLKVGDAIEY
mgnify:CR=1 FL=1